MRTLRLISLLSLCVLFYAGTAFGLTLNFSSLQNASLTFYGYNDSFIFQPEGTNDFTITSVNNGTGNTVGLGGSISGTFTIGSITQNGFAETAPVTGVGLVTITDNSNQPLTAQLEWIDIITVYGIGGVNFQGIANLTNFVYSGSNPDLKAFYDKGVITSSFQFSATKGLTALTTERENSTSFSGSMTPFTSVPEPTTLFLMGSGLIGFGVYVRKKFKK